jgi:hypothetical protein
MPRFLKIPVAVGINIIATPVASNVTFLPRQIGIKPAIPNGNSSSVAVI